MPNSKLVLVTGVTGQQGGAVGRALITKELDSSTAALSPFFGVALAPTGEYVHDLDIRELRI